MKFKYKMLIVLIISVILFSVYAIFTYDDVKEHNESKLNNSDKFILTENNKIKVCGNDYCITEGNFRNYEYYNYKSYFGLEEMFVEFNDGINKLKENTLDSSDSLCDANYYFNTVYEFNYSLYDNEDYISIGYEVLEKNICNGSIVPIRNYYLYDKKQQKRITGEELIKNLGFNKEEIIERINNYLKDYNSNVDDELEKYDENINYEDLLYFYDNDGSLKVAFYLNDKKYYLSIIL